MIRHVLDEYTKLMPTILEIPSKKNAYDVNKDSLMKRILKMCPDTDGSEGSSLNM
jgi:vacuolar-type H+-ATPase subunit F/Vma7